MEVVVYIIGFIILLFLFFGKKVKPNRGQQSYSKTIEREQKRIADLIEKTYKTEKLSSKVSNVRGALFMLDAFLHNASEEIQNDFGVSLSGVDKFEKEIEDHAKRLSPIGIGDLEGNWTEFQKAYKFLERAEKAKTQKTKIKNYQQAASELNYILNRPKDFDMETVKEAERIVKLSEV